MLATRATEVLGIRYPITQGGLAHLAFAELAAAVSNAGGLGQITASTLESVDVLAQQIVAVQELTDQPFAINFQLGRRDLSEMVLIAAEMGVPAMSFTAGDPRQYFQLLEGTAVRKICLVATVRQAQNAEALGADVVVAVGQEGGGHIGRDDLGTLVLVPRIAESVNIPVLASGGIGDGRGLMAALALGADGIEMGTRFIVTRECIAHMNYKQAIIDAQEDGTMVVERSIGRPARVLRTPVAEAILQVEQLGGSIEELLPLMSRDMNLVAAHGGDMQAGFVWVGQVAGLIHDIPTVAELMERIVREAGTIGRRLGQLSGEE